MRLAFSLALARAGSSIAARIAMMAITTSNSINVNPPAGRHDRCRARKGAFNSACRRILVIGPHRLSDLLAVIIFSSYRRVGGPGYHSGPPDPAVYEKFTSPHVLFYL